MDYLLLAEVLKSLEHLDCKPPDQRKRHALEVVVLDELVEVD